MLSDLTQLQRQVLKFYLDVFSDSNGDIQLYKARTHGQMGLTSFSREVKVAHILLPTDDGSTMHFYGTLGDSLAEVGKAVDHEHQFICIFDEKYDEAAVMVAYARVHHDIAGLLDAHSSFLLEETSALRSRGYSNVLVARADLFTPFENKNNALLAGVPNRILSLVPLEPREWTIKVEKGIDALFDEFKAIGRDLLCLRPVLDG
ncbi:hypothetical protein LZC95_32090 [Pendulispora brunnea]|uniref:Uncharacterized protein n=1 Tax=Pendulispora brunnea TaxID=2905690 RepID=A0ABZ2JX71_9BACT